MSLETLRAVVIRAFPELAGSAFTLLTEGWDCLAVDVDDRLIFKFPRYEAAGRALLREASLLTVIRPAVTIPVPALAVDPGPPLFSRHVKLAGEHLLSRQYELLPDAARQRLAADMALFYAELHRLDARAMAAAGAGPIVPWLPPEDILRRVWPVLPPGLRRYADRAVAAWQQLPPDPYGTTFGFFDGHGWNMAFDHARGQLNGIYDFADAGFGPLHQELIYTNLIAADLTARTIACYEVLTGLALDRWRIDLLNGMLRLSELAEFADDSSHAAAMVQAVADWAARHRLDGCRPAALQRSFTKARPPSESRAMKAIFFDCTPFLHELYQRELRDIVPDLEIHIGNPTRDEAIALLADATFAMNDHTQMDETLLAACPNLKAIVFLGTGAASFIDLAAAERLGIRVRAYGGYGDQSVAEHSVALMFAAARQVATMDRAIRRGEWEARNGIELAGKVLGVIGTGGIGKVMVRLGAGLGMRVIAWNRSGVPGDLPCEAVELDALLEQADVVSLHLALNEGSRGLIDRRRIDLLRPGAILINTARGAIVDEPALVEALQEGRIGHAGLDVFADEPLPANHPLTRLDNVTLTAHAAFATEEASARLLRMALEILAEERAA